MECICYAITCLLLPALPFQEVREEIEHALESRAFGWGRLHLCWFLLLLFLLHLFQANLLRCWSAGSFRDVPKVLIHISMLFAVPYRM